MKPYALIADCHLHRWSKFSTTDSDGVNSRLRGLLNEIHRAAKTTHDQGGNTVVIAGDLFHVRGSVAPSVLNPTLDEFRSIHDLYGTRFIIVAGNHDLEGKDSTRVGSAVTALENDFTTVVNMPQADTSVKAVLLPWYERIDELKAKIEEISNSMTALDMIDADLIIHAPIDGVLPHLSGGLDPAWLASKNFRRVFAGHYHHHKEFPGGVYSIGALAHHTWSDVGSLAGFLIVTEDSVTRHASHLPSFIDVTHGEDADEIALRADGNFVRAKVTTSKMAEVERLRTLLQSQGAIGVEIINVREPTTERTGAIAASVAAGASVERSIADFVKACATIAADLKGEVEMEALKVLAEASV